METTKFSIPSISCSACANKIKEGIMSMNGVENATVDLKTQTVEVNYDPHGIQAQDIRKKVASLGYEVTL